MQRCEPCTGLIFQVVFSLCIFLFCFVCQYQSTPSPTSVSFDTYSTYTLVFTDGSKENNKAALAVIFPAKVYSQKLPYGTSIYTTELLAIRAALHDTPNISKFSLKTSIIFTDTLSALQSLESQKLHQSLIFKYTYYYTSPT